MSQNVISEAWRAYNTKEGLEKIVKEIKSFGRVYWLVYVIVSFFCIYSLETTSFNLVMLSIFSTWFFTSKDKMIGEAKINRKSIYQGFGCAKDMYLWLLKTCNIKGEDRVNKKQLIMGGIFPKGGLFKFLIKIVFILILSLIFSYFGFYLFAFSFIPLFVASLYSWIDGGYKYAWGMTEDLSKAGIYAFLCMEGLVFEPPGMVSKTSELEVERLFALLKADDSINWILIPKLLDFPKPETMGAVDNARVN
jgi:hypothetical protein